MIRYHQMIQQNQGYLEDLVDQPHLDFLVSPMDLVSLVGLVDHWILLVQVVRCHPYHLSDLSDLVVQQDQEIQQVQKDLEVLADHYFHDYLESQHLLWGH